MGATELPWPTLRLAPYLCPDLIVILLACAIVYVVRSWRAAGWGEMRQAGQSVFRRGRALCLALVTPPEVLFIWILVSGTVLSTLGLFFAIRYLTLVVPFLFILVGLVLVWGLSSARARVIALLCLIAFNLVNRNGACFPSLTSGPPVENCGFFKNWERSHEYLPLHRANLAAVHLLERSHHDETIITSFPFSHFLGLPRLGYVMRPLHGYCLGIGNAVPTFKNIDKWQGNASADPIFACDRFATYFFVAVERGDDILYEDHLAPPLVVYKKHWLETPPHAPGEIERWYQDHQSGSSFANRVTSRGIYLVHSGRTAQAVDELRAAIQYGSGVAPLRLQLAYLLREQKNLDEASEQFVRYLDVVPGDMDANQLLMAIQWERGQFDQVLARARRLATDNPGSKQACSLLVNACLRLEKYGEAKIWLEKLVKLDPQDGDAWFHLGYAYLVERDQQKAADSLSEALKHPLSAKNAEKARQHLARIGQRS